MARKIKPLSAMEVKEAKPRDKEYSLPDGDGLLLRIRPTGSKTWLFNYQLPTTKKRTNIKIGSFPEISLAQARAKREEFRALLAQGIDPQEEKERKQQELFVRSHKNKEKKNNRELAEFFGNKWDRSIENRGFAVHCPCFVIGKRKNDELRKFWQNRQNEPLKTRSESECFRAFKLCLNVLGVFGFKGLN